jgi:glycosyltransferase involved in cell wall biosynthesis
MTRKPRLAVISVMEAFPWGGSEELWARTAEAGVSEGWRVIASVKAWPDPHHRLKELATRGVEVAERATPLQWSARAGRAWLRIRPPFAEVRAFRPDVLLVSLGGLFDLALRDETFQGFRLAAKATPHVVVCHLTADLPVTETMRMRTREVVANAAEVLFVSEANRLEAERLLGTSLDRARVVRNPVNVTGRFPLPWPGEETMRLASVARLEAWYKGQDLLLEVLGGDAWRSRPWRLSMFGTGPDEPHLRNLVRRYGLEDRVAFHGHVRDVRRIWNEHHALVLPSRAEGAPLSMVEAMLCGRPVIGTRVGGIGEWVANGVTGYLAPSHSVAALAATLEQAWADRSRWQEMGRRAHEVATELVEPDPGGTLLRILEAAARSQEGVREAI